MNHLIVAPVMLPALVAALALLGMRMTLRLGRIIALTSCLSLLAIAVALLAQANAGTVQSYEVGDWRAPFGIVLVLDRLSAMMLVLTALLSTLVLIHVIATDLDRRGWHFHPLFQFQLLGLNGAFLTGDLFNLFVFFEILLIASYGLMLHGQGGERLKAGLQYVVVNLVGSTLFLIGVGLLYGVAGTLNMADLAVRISQLPEADLGIARAGGLILLTVFGLKAALLPLHLWLPRTYANTSAPVAALFAILTKVGVYSILRIFFLVFGSTAGPLAGLAAPWMLPAALLTVAVGFVGLFAAKSVRELAAYGVVGSTGTLLVALSMFDQPALAAGLYYLPHSTFSAALIFLVADLILRRRGKWADSLEVSPRFPGLEPIGVVYFLAAIALAGLPPLSGFIGKLLILTSTAGHPWAAWIWGVILCTTLLAVLGLARAGSLLFWKGAGPEDGQLPGNRARPEDFIAPAAMLAILASLSIFAHPVTRFMEATAAQLSSPADYVGGVLGRGGMR